MKMSLTPEQIAESKGEIIEKVKEAILAFLTAKEDEHGKVFVALTLEEPTGQADRVGEAFKMNVVFGLYKVIFQEKPEKISLELYDIESFFKNVMLSLADNIAQRLQVRAMISATGKNVFPEVEKGIQANLKPGQIVMIFKKNEEVVFTLNEGETYLKTINPDEILF